jgi:hypothetical protein
MKFSYGKLSLFKDSSYDRRDLKSNEINLKNTQKETKLTCYYAPNTVTSLIC